LALVLTFSISAVSPAFAQTPVATTTAAGSPDDPSEDGAKATEEQPKPEKLKGEEPAADAPVAPSVDAAKPKPEAPKATEPKPSGDDAKPEKPKAAAPKPTKAEQTKPAEPQPKPDEPKAPTDAPAAAPHVAAGPSTSAAAPATQPVAGPSPKGQAAHAPTGQAAHAVAGARAQHLGTTRPERTKARPDRSGAPGAARSDPARIGTGGESVGAAPAIGGSANPATTHTARLASDDATPAAAPSERRPIRALQLDAGPSGYDLTLLLTIVFTAGVAFLIGRETRRLPRVGARR
jgi:hypothetical protein